jgi:hypothetical protein
MQKEDEHVKWSALNGKNKAEAGKVGGKKSQSLRQVEGRGGGGEVRG